MSCSNGILNGRLIHELSEKEESMHVVYIRDRDPICHMQLFQMNHFTLMLKTKVKLACRTECPLHRALPCTIIQGGIDSNGPSDESGTGFKQRGNQRSKRRNPSRAAGGYKETWDPSGIKRSCCGPEGERSATVLELKGAIGTLTH